MNDEWWMLTVNDAPLVSETLIFWPYMLTSPPFIERWKKKKLKKPLAFDVRISRFSAWKRYPHQLIWLKPFYLNRAHSTYRAHIVHKSCTYRAHIVQLATRFRWSWEAERKPTSIKPTDRQRDREIDSRERFTRFDFWYSIQRWDLQLCSMQLCNYAFCYLIFLRAWKRVSERLSVLQL